MLRSLVAVLAGFAAMALIVIVSTTIAAEALLPGGMRGMAEPGTPLPRAYLWVNLGASAFAALMGGFIAGWIATTAAVEHGIGLAGLMAVLGVVSKRRAGTTQPRWYQMALRFVLPLVAIAGAWMAGGWLVTP